MILPRRMIESGAILLVTLIVMKLTKQIAAPIVLALVLGVILSPLVDRAARNSIPSAAVALLMTFATCAAIGLFGWFLAPVIEKVAHRIPQITYELRNSMDQFLALGDDLKEVSNEMTEAIGRVDAGEGAAAEVPSLMDAVLIAPQVAGQVFVFLGTLFFFLLTRRDIYGWLAKAVWPENSTHGLTHRLLESDRCVSRYFSTITMVNGLLGCAVAIGLYGFGMPSPGAWGLIAFVANFFMYLGPALFALALLVGGISEFDGLMSYGPLIMFLSMNFLEGNFLTPSLVGMRLSLNTLLVFVTIMVGLWLWGPVGGIVALPILVWFLAAAGQLNVATPRATGILNDRHEMIGDKKN